jgi:site-specific DNA-methyltransferase (adenine-specific)
MFRTGKPKERSAPSNPQGRFPSNVIFDEEAAAMLDKQSGTLKSGDNCTRQKAGSFLEHGGLGNAGDIQTTYGDMGGASRFFYCAKASSSERNQGCDDMPDSDKHTTYGDYKGTPEHSANVNSKSKNFHPTVKPIKLIKYLVTLVTPKGGICLDLFEGSGTHGVACRELDFDFIGFEKDESYYKIAQQRLDAAMAQVSMF